MVLSKEQANELTAIFEKINEECKSVFEEKTQMIAIKLLELLILCDRFFKKKAVCTCSPDYSDTLQRFNGLIESNFSKHRYVQFYAGALFWGLTIFLVFYQLHPLTGYTTFCLHGVQTRS
jgi:hypothetical protein